MKKSYLTLLLFLLSGLIFVQGQTINSFDTADPDTNYFLFFESDNAVSDSSYLNVSFVTDNVQEGSGAMLLEYMANNAESWGGFVKLEHWTSDSMGTYDWSLYDTLSFWYNNVVPQDESGRVHLRVNLHEVSNSPSGNFTYDVGDVEYYYSFQYILDNEPGWNRIDIPIVNNYDWDGNGFNLTGWSGITGNSVLEKDKIKGYSLEFSINGGGEGDAVSGSIILDHMHLRGIAERSIVLFNGAVVPSNVTLSNGGWNNHAFEITDEDAFTEGTKSIKWTTSDWAEWGGMNFTLNAPVNMGYHWTTDSLKVNLKVPEGFGDLKLIFLDDVDTTLVGDLEFEAGYMLTAAEMGWDGTWKSIVVALSDFNRFEGGWDGSGTAPGEMDSTRVNQFRIITTNQPESKNQVLYLDNLWTGSPFFDVIAPDAPALVSAAGGTFVNLVTWTDVPGESNEVYDVYYSMSPITDLNDAGLEIVQIGVAEDLQVVEHVLRAPAVDQDITYYYAVVCRDEAGNTSEIKSADSPITNLAKGVTIINPTAPAGFVADGDLTEWAGITPFRMFPSDGSGTIVTNQDIDGDADLSVNAYVAMDDEFLYVAFDVEDDIISSDTNIVSYLRDGCDMFIGLYDWRGPTHTNYQRGAEPDYQFRFVKQGAILTNLGDFLMATPEDENYAYFEKFPSGYTMEGRFAFADIAAVAEPSDEVFKPIVGKRIKIDYSINDADATGQREGIMTLSPLNEDRSWAEVNRWTYTWIGDQFVDVADKSTIPLKYELSQNYPNPFNPTTVINYSVMDKANVILKVYNILGQEVATLVNGVKNAGVYQVNFDASQLSTGMYIYQIQAGSFVTSKKMMLLK